MLADRNEGQTIYMYARYMPHSAYYTDTSIPKLQIPQSMNPTLMNLLSHRRVDAIPTHPPPSVHEEWMASPT